MLDWISVGFIAVGLAMDAFAVSISSGLTISKVKLRDALKIALCFGLFQAGMPVIGWLAGGLFSEYIQGCDHWIAMILLGYIGAKMIVEGIKGDGEEIKGNPLNLKTLLILGVATSIDALIVGVNFAFIQSPIVFPAVCIGVVTFGISLIGVFFGKKFGELIGKKAEIVGGVVLILIGLKILLEHLFF